MKYGISTRQCFCFSNHFIVWVKHCAETLKCDTHNEYIWVEAGTVRMKRENKTSSLSQMSMSFILKAGQLCEWIYFVEMFSGHLNEFLNIWHWIYMIISYKFWPSSTDIKNSQIFGNYFEKFAKRIADMYALVIRRLSIDGVAMLSSGLNMNCNR